MTVRATSLPAGSALAPLREWATWTDCWEAPVTRIELSALELHLAMMRLTPRWVDPLMDWRDRFARLAGLRPVGRFDAAAYPRVVTPGDRLGIFTVRAVTHTEIVMGDDDRHLDFRLSVSRYEAEGPKVAVAMVLKTHNRLGRLYMLAVGPIHKIIVRSMLTRAVARGVI